MRRAAFALLLLASLLVGAPAQAAPGNHGFERGLNGWQQWAKGKQPDCGYWTTYEGTTIPDLDPYGDGVLPAPPQGRFAAVAVQPACPSAMAISQVVRLRKGRRHTLRFRFAYHSEAARFYAPRTLKLNGRQNQQFRVDVLKAGAPIRSVAKRHVLKTVYRTRPGDRRRQGVYRGVKANLTRFAGKRVKLRFAVAVNVAPLTVGVDDVRIVSKKKK